MRVRKKTRKPFKSTLDTNTVTGTIVHPQLGGLAYVFEEDDSYVELGKCDIVDASTYDPPIAACTLLLHPTDRNQILGFRKHGFTGWDLPGGKGEGFEHPRSTAKRELIEETGYTPHFLPLKPYCAPIDKFIVYTYIGYPKAQALTHQDEGIFQWIHIKKLSTGRFWKYNEQMLKHFQIQGF